MTYPLQLRQQVLEMRANEGPTISEVAARFGVRAALGAADHVDDPADHTTVVNPRHPARLVRKQRLRSRKLFIRKPETMIRHRFHRLKPGEGNHGSDDLGIHFMGPEPNIHHHAPKCN